MPPILLFTAQFERTSSNRLMTVPPEIGQLTDLQELVLSINRLTSVPSEISQLASLRLLILNDNQLTTVPSEIGLLSRLHSLDLSNNKLMDAPLGISQLSSLQMLNLNGNQLTAVPLKITEMTSLRKLYLNRNRLTILPPQIDQLTNLQELTLGGNKLTAVPLQICQLTRLQKLHLNNNRLITLFMQIGQLTNLQELILGGNELTTVPREISKLIDLQSLDLSRNQLTMLPTALRQLTKLHTLHLYGNPLPLPPELLDTYSHPSPSTSLDAYFQGSRPLREAKLLLVGEGSVGKTSLVERLLYNRPPGVSGKTVGVDIHKWDLRITIDDLRLENDRLAIKDNGLRVNVWDFGGQEIYHTTHQFFLTHRSLYLVVLETRKDEAANRIEYWLRHVQSFAGNAPIVLVVNKSDQGSLSLDERELLLKYPTIRAIVHTSCIEGTNIPKLRKTIEETLATLPHINDWIPLTWFAVKEKLAESGKDFLPYENFVDLCEAEGITHKAAQQTLARFLHDLGAALNFQDDRRLAGTHVLNPEWVTGGIYHIFNAPKLQERGILHLRDLDEILDGRRYPPYKHPFLLDIMGKFELAAPLADRQSYLIPGLLPKERPAFDWPNNATVALEYRYAILPAAVLSRLMVRLHNHIWQPERGHPIRWRNGLGVSSDGCRGLIITDSTTARLTIALDGPAPHRRHLLAIIRAELDEIHASFARLEAEEFVPIPGYPPEKAIAYEDLLYYESEQDWTPRYAPIKARIDVRALLDGIEFPEERDIRALMAFLHQRFNKAELRQLAFDVLVDHEDLPGETKTDLARELVLKCRRQGRLAELEEKLGRERPNLRS